MSAHARTGDTPDERADYDDAVEQLRRVAQQYQGASPYADAVVLLERMIQVGPWEWFRRTLEQQHQNADVNSLYYLKPVVIPASSLQGAQLAAFQALARTTSGEGMMQQQLPEGVFIDCEDSTVNPVIFYHDQHLAEMLAVYEQTTGNYVTPEKAKQLCRQNQTKPKQPELLHLLLGAEQELSDAATLMREIIEANNREQEDEKDTTGIDVYRVAAGSESGRDLGAGLGAHPSDRDAFIDDLVGDCNMKRLGRWISPLQLKSAIQWLMQTADEKARQHGTRSHRFNPTDMYSEGIQCLLQFHLYSQDDTTLSDWFEDEFERYTPDKNRISVIKPVATPLSVVYTAQQVALEALLRAGCAEQLMRTKHPDIAMDQNYAAYKLAHTVFYSHAALSDMLKAIKEEGGESLTLDDAIRRVRSVGPTDDLMYLLFGDETAGGRPHSQFVQRVRARLLRRGQRAGSPLEQAFRGPGGVTLEAPVGVASTEREQHGASGLGRRLNKFATPGLDRPQTRGRLLDVPSTEREQHGASGLGMRSRKFDKPEPDRPQTRGRLLDVPSTESEQHGASGLGMRSRKFDKPEPDRPPTRGRALAGESAPQRARSRHHPSGDDGGHSSALKPADSSAVKKIARGEVSYVMLQEFIDFADTARRFNRTNLVRATLVSPALKGVEPIDLNLSRTVAGTLTEEVLQLALENQAAIVLVFKHTDGSAHQLLCEGLHLLAHQADTALGYVVCSDLKFRPAGAGSARPKI